MADETQPAEGAPPQFVPAERFREVEQQLAGFREVIENNQRTMQGLHAMLLESRRQGAAPPPPAVTEDVSEAELDEAVTTGAGAGHKITRKVQAAVERLVRERIDPLQRTGLEAMSTFAAEMARNARTEKGDLAMPYYARFKDEIEGIVANLNPGFRVNPRTYMEAYATVVGRHATELIEEAKTGAVKELEKGSGDPPSPNGRVGRTAGKGGVPAIEDVYSADVVKALGGQSSDQFAASLGYKDWADYYQKTIATA
jgi:hypothetical protein